MSPTAPNVTIQGWFVHKWFANDAATLQDVPEDEHEKLVQLNDMSANEVMETLGLTWNARSDEFLFCQSPSSFDETSTFLRSCKNVRSARPTRSKYHSSKAFDAANLGC